ncbi:hypothetical protein H8E77_00025 [bacterium]|nr:hypothetical protein [bacterium]
MSSAYIDTPVMGRSKLEIPKKELEYTVKRQGVLTLKSGNPGVDQRRCYHRGAWLNADCPKKKSGVALF